MSGKGLKKRGRDAEEININKLQTYDAYKLLKFEWAIERFC